MKARCYMVLISLLVWLGLVATVAQEQSHSVQQSSPLSTVPIVPEDLLQRSYSAGDKLAAEERCYQLMMLTKVAEQLSSARAKSYVATWSDELFRHASELLPSWNRSAFQKNAIESLASVEPAKAAAMLLKVDWPVSSESFPVEDLRAFAAITVYRRLWEHENIAALPLIQAQARDIGNTGEYPYIAIMEISQKLRERKVSDPPLLLFREALDFYEKGPYVQVADRDFITYLEAEWLYLPSNLKAEAVTVIVDHLTKDQRTNRHISETVHFVTDKGTAQFSNRSSALLYRILPKIHEVKPELANQLEEQHPELKQAAGASVQFTSAATVVGAGDASAEQVAAVRDRLLQGQVLGQLRKQARDDPQKAAGLLPSITDSELQIEALASLASAFRDSQPTRSLELFNEARNRTDALPETAGKLSSLAAVAGAAASMHNNLETESAMGKAFNVGEELLAEDLDTHPGQTVYDSAIREDLCTIARTGGQFSLSSTLTRIDRVSDETLRAYLLIAAAEGLYEAQREKVPKQAIP